MNNYISTYALYHPNDAYLEHGLSWGKHRYIKRTGTPGNYEYTYAEDLRNAGRNLASGARNLISRASSAASNAASVARRTVRNAGQAAARATGIAQRRSDERARNEMIKWSILESNSSRRGSQQNHEYARKNLERAEENAYRARQEYRKTPLGKLENFDLGVSLKRLRSSVSFDASSFLNSKLGSDGRAKIRRCQEAYSEAFDAAARNAFSRSAYAQLQFDLLDKAEAQYRDAVEDYGKTFLGKCEKLLKTRFSSVQIKDFNNWTTYKVG